MEKKKVDLGAVAAEAGKNAKAFWGKAKETIVKEGNQTSTYKCTFQNIKQRKKARRLFVRGFGVTNVRKIDKCLFRCCS